MVTRRRRLWLWPVVAIVVVAAATTTPVRAGTGRFIASLRMAKPTPVSTSLAGGAATTGNRRLQDAVAAMVTASPTVTRDEADEPATNGTMAASLAGFAVHRVSARRDSASFAIVGARDVSASIDRSQLRTILDEAGRADVPTSDAIAGATIQLRAPRAVRIQYGHCPPPASNTLQGQLQGPPPPSTDYGDCVELFESPPMAGSAPDALRMDQLAEIALELTAMSPNQTRDFQRIFDWRSTLVIPLPRGMRSYDTVSVGGSPGMLINTAARRGPTYALAWRDTGLVYVLSGYGNPGDAVALARSVR